MAHGGRGTHNSGRPGGVVEGRHREIRDVRYPLQPDVCVERVLVGPTGVHVVSSLPGGVTEALLGTGAGWLGVAMQAADLVAALLPTRYRVRVTPVLCRDDGASLAKWVEGVLVTSLPTLDHILKASPVVLSTSEVQDIARRLEARLEPLPRRDARRPPRRRSWRRIETLVGVASGVAVTVTAVVLVQQVTGAALPW